MSHRKAILGVLLVFLLGCAAGVIGSSIVRHYLLERVIAQGPERVVSLLEQRLVGNLGLDAAQRSKMDALFADNLRQRRELQKQIQPQVRQLNLETFRQVDALLTPEQTAKFHQNLERMRHRGWQK